ncbi:MAG: sulfatase-like hydrolase/transferase [Verrucomicrobiae bacterium]|nr:sulfatase-like hydrolase/transferase [Verrucomicrobiae bacterium]
MRSLLVLTLCFLGAVPGGRSQENPGPDAPRRPNVVLIFTDDHGVGDVSVYGASDLRTPHLDRLASEGMRFTTMRANATVCSPSRAALLTGRFPDRVGVPGVIRTDPADSWGHLDPTVPTLADELRRAGYHTALVGKWHLGLDAPNTPNERGFDFFHGFLGDMMDSYTNHLRHGRNYLRRDTEVISPSGHATELFTEWAINHLQSRATRPEHPFFLLLAYNAPHFPIEPPTSWLDRVRTREPGLEERRARNVAFVEHLDDAIGRVLRALKDTGLEADTLVVFTADNGGSLPHGQSNHPWRDGKQSHYDGGLRVPFIARWPGVIAPGSLSDHAGLVFDLFPTFLELAEVRPAEDLDAVSLLPVFRGRRTAEPRELYFVRREGGPTYGGKSYEAIVRGDWKLLQNAPYQPLELYHLRDDPQERTNLIATRPEVVRELGPALRRHIQRGGATPWQQRAP